MSPAVTWMCILVLCHLLALRGCNAWQSLVERCRKYLMMLNESEWHGNHSVTIYAKALNLRKSQAVIHWSDLENWFRIRWKHLETICWKMQQKNTRSWVPNAPRKVRKHQLWCLETSSVPLVTGAVFASPAPPGMDETWWNHMKPIVPPMRSKKGHIKAAKINQNQIRDSTYLNMHASNIF